MVVHGEPGLDEVSPLGPTHVLEVRDGDVREWTIDPAPLGLATSDAPRARPEATRGRTRASSRASSTGTSAAGARAAVVLNAAAAIYVSGDEDDFVRSVRRAEQALEGGEACRALERLRAATRK